jgi:hypothetical protein
MQTPQLFGDDRAAACRDPKDHPSPEVGDRTGRSVAQEVGDELQGEIRSDIGVNSRYVHLRRQAPYSDPR